MTKNLNSIVKQLATDPAAAHRMIIEYIFFQSYHLDLDKGLAHYIIWKNDEKNFGRIIDDYINDLHDEFMQQQQNVNPADIKPCYSSGKRLN